jgi:hypothetical protein
LRSCCAVVFFVVSSLKAKRDCGDWCRNFRGLRKLPSPAEYYPLNLIRRLDRVLISRLKMPVPPLFFVLASTILRVFATVAVKALITGYATTDFASNFLQPSFLPHWRRNYNRKNLLPIPCKVTHAATLLRIPAELAFLLSIPGASRSSS